MSTGSRSLADALIGIDLGGTKIETRVFGPQWDVLSRRRRETPGDYAALVDALEAEIAWARDDIGRQVPAGICAPGRVSPVDGRVLTANLPATGRALGPDVAKRAGGAVIVMNDAEAFAMSEAALGAGQGARSVLGLVIGTGLGGALVVDGRLLPAHGGFGGETGHGSLPASAVARLGLPILTCGCGRSGCAETLLAGPGIARLSEAVEGQTIEAEAMAAERGKTWEVWIELMARHLSDLALLADPGVIVLGGGLSQIEGLAPTLAEAMSAGPLPGFPAPRIAIAEGGASSGARGAALLAQRSVSEAAT